MFKDKTLLITGGTGSFGNAVIKRFLNTGIKEIRIFSRDEKKQDDMRIAYNNDKLKFFEALHTNAVGTENLVVYAFQFRLTTKGTKVNAKT
jgi:FlaA1/EpsC-like NDP-sugar epimerase